MRGCRGQLIRRVMPSGEARIYLRWRDENGHWRETFTGTGKRRVAERYREAWREEQYFKFQIEKCKFQNDIESVGEQWVAHLEANGRGEKYVKRAEYLIKRIHNPEFRIKHGRGWGEVVEEYKRAQIGRGRVENGINADLRILKALFNWAAERGLSAPVKVRLLRGEQKLARFLDETEIAQFFAAVRTAPLKRHRLDSGFRGNNKEEEEALREYWKLVFEVFLYTGGRKEEVAGLLWGDVDLANGLIRFRKTKSRRERWVEIEPWLVEKLRHYKGRGQGSDRVWWHEGNWIYEQYRHFAAAAGFQDREKGVLHCLRHTLVWRLIRAGVDIRTVAEIIGHSDPALTLRVYAHVAPWQKREAMRRLAAPG